MKNFDRLDKFMVSEMHHWAIPALRVALGIVFLWFGALKVFGVSPVLDLVRDTYSFMPYPAFFIFLGAWEMVIGLGLMFKIALRTTLALLWLQMAGTLIAPLLQPGMFFDGGNIFLLTIPGEFVVKNLVLIAAGFVIGGYEVKPPAK
jgi:uncharacterized membrane protein YkgB